jgi:hypothetical protein
MQLRLDFIAEQFGGKLTCKQKNVSAYAYTTLSPDFEAMPRVAREKELALYDRLIAGGGYLKNLRA